ncbi:MAG: adenylate/guanylate cyclase domain-containing protein [Halieaceae bacterium]|nr:adenylate/guanylate cyclase domain-containing protein [Halieaceae bacterium]
MSSTSTATALSRQRIVELNDLLNETLAELDKADLFEESTLLATSLSALTAGHTEALSRHDLLNYYTSACGYAEILLEELDDTAHISLQTGLTNLVTAIRELSETPEGVAKANSSYKLEPITTTVGSILVVDDQSDNRTVLERLLSRVGHTVYTADSGEAALDQLTRHPIDIVLLDLSMPGMGGKTALTKIKADPKLRSIPVIVISGHQDLDSVVECITLGADDYLFKPFNSVLLHARIAAGLDRKQWHDRELNYLHQLEQRERFIRATFGRYLTDEIVADILEKPEGLRLGGDLKEITILMADIRGFTQLCSQMPPEQVVSLLNGYLGTMTEIIMRHNGTIDEFLGDAILAVFGAPKDDPNHAQSAVACSVEMQQAVAAVNRQHRTANLPQISTGIAINTGTVVAGNIGSDRRAKYGFVGTPMNVTSRIEDLCEANEILISDATKQALRNGDRLYDKGTHSLKGIDQPVRIFGVKWQN